MKTSYLIAASILLAATTSWQANAQMPMTADYKPSGPLGQSDEATIATTYGCLPQGFPTLPENTNAYGATELFMFEWTVHALNCGNMTGKSLIRFDQMCSLPPTAIIDYAELRLFGIPSSPVITVGNSWYPGTPYSDNIGWVKQITSPWTKTGVTWTLQPTTSIVDEMPIASTLTQWNNYSAIDVTPLTRDIQTSILTTGNNYGYWLELQNTTYYRSTLWASSFDATPANWPELYIQYHLPCNANFTACNTTENPNTYNFTAEDGTYPDTYTWDFGDGTPPVTGTSVSHTYTSPGSYQVCLTLSRDGGQPLCTECNIVCVNKIAQPCIPANKRSNGGTTSVQALPAFDGTIIITSVSPNPTSSTLNVNMRLIAGGDVQYKVYDMTGKEVLNGKTSMGKGQQSMSIPVEKLVAGTYVLEMADNYSKTNTKFTKE